MSPSVLLLTTYPIVKPRHGGQVRARALVNAYRAAGFSVTHLAVVDQGGFPRNALGPLDLEFPTEDPRWFIDGKPMAATTDLRAGTFAAESTDAFQRALGSLPERVDVFHLEQPWLLPFVRRLKREARFARSVIVYGSQNIEAPLREAIFKQSGSPHGPEVVSRVAALEASACRLADLTLAVSAADQEALKSLGANEVLLAPNGIDAWEPNEALVESWRTNLKARRVALFVGSAHPPNVVGFIRALGDSLGLVPPDCKVVVAGGVGPLLAEHYFGGPFDTLNRSRLEITGQLDEHDLAALKTLAAVFLLPIFEGGGSNIKTAEALYSGKSVIATSISLRGYEGYLRLPELTLADTRDDFRDALQRAFTGPQLKAPSAARTELLWSARLRVVPPAVRRLLAS